MDLKIISQGGVNSLVNDNKVIFDSSNKDASNYTSLKKDRSGLVENDVKQVVDNLNKELEKEKFHAEYSVYKSLNTITIKIISDDTNEVVMELPPEKILDLITKMCELNGVIVDKDV